MCRIFWNVPKFENVQIFWNIGNFLNVGNLGNVPIFLRLSEGLLLLKFRSKDYSVCMCDYVNLAFDLSKHVFSFFRFGAQIPFERFHIFDLVLEI